MAQNSGRETGPLLGTEPEAKKPEALGGTGTSKRGAQKAGTRGRLPDRADRHTDPQDGSRGKKKKPRLLLAS